MILRFNRYRFFLVEPLNSLPLRRAERSAVVIASSQKTLPVAMTVLLSLPPSFGDPGLTAIPVVVAHFVQIIIDAVLAAHWAGQQQAADAARRRRRRRRKGGAAAAPTPAAGKEGGEEAEEEVEDGGYGLRLWTWCCS